MRKRNSEDINPEALSPNRQEFSNTLSLKKPHRVFSAIGISFYACAFFEDFNVGGFAHDPHFHGPFPESILTISAAGGQFDVEDDFFARVVSVVEGLVGRSREP